MENCQAVCIRKGENLIREGYSQETTRLNFCLFLVHKPYSY